MAAAACYDRFGLQGRIEAENVAYDRNRGHMAWIHDIYDNDQTIDRLHAD
jgi:hypothetical protein